MAREILSSPVAHERMQRALAWLAARPRAEPLLVVSSSLPAADALLRRAAQARTALFGWQRESLVTLAAKTAATALAAEGRAPLSAFGAEAATARVVFELHAQGVLGRFAHVAERPGLGRALCATIAELALAGIAPDAAGLDPDLGRVYAAYREQLARVGLADRAAVLAAAARVAAIAPQPPLGLATLFWDVRVTTALECEWVRAIAEQAPLCMATLPTLDARSRQYLERALGVTAQRSARRPGNAGTAGTATGAPALRRLQEQLFETQLEKGELGDEISILSAPGEARECVEIARRVLREAERGVRFDDMAILVRTPERYASHLAEALARARIPAYFSRGTLRPDPAARALLALLACAAEGLSARRFADYLSIGMVPRTTTAGEPPPALDREARFVPPDDELMPLAPAAIDEGEAEQGALPDSVPVPRHWERLLIGAAVIGGLDRWQRRLDGLDHQLQVDLHAAAETPERIAGIERDRHALSTLRAFALPLMQALHELPATANWGTWLDVLSALATRALAEPASVLRGLAELAPMAPVGPVGLSEVRLVLERRFGEQRVRPGKSAAGKLLVAAIDEARGMAFEVVFIPGMAEKMFPPRIHEDPLLLDGERARLSPHLPRADDRIADERCALQIAIGAARARVVVSYPRFETERGRPRVPSFYGLEVLRAAEGELPGFAELAQRATDEAHARMGWPAPRNARDAIDAAEYDLCVLERFRKSEGDWDGAAHYLLSANPYLERALRFRAQRWHTRFFPADGLVHAGEAGEAIDAPLRAALSAHGLGARAYSATALSKYAVCPYRFYLSAIVGLSARAVPEPIEVVDARTRGVLLHEVLRVFSTRMRELGLLPVTQAAEPRAQQELDRALDEVAARAHDDLAPAIERVWDDGVLELRADLREWLARAAQEPWTPLHFELGFGVALPGLDAASRTEAVALDCGIVLRGAIDSVEVNGDALRATDYKTGAAPAPGGVIDGGRSLQRVLYAQALQKLFPDRRIAGADEYYCTSRGGFLRLPVALDARATEAAALVAKNVGTAIEQAFLPAAPERDACERCEFLAVCGPYEVQRVGRKDPRRLRALAQLRREP
jgi:ATP-dependent helicase/nuclease subunit B